VVFSRPNAKGRPCNGRQFFGPVGELGCCHAIADLNYFPFACVFPNKSKTSRFVIPVPYLMREPTERA
jgi:hypothetical protein